MKISSFKPPHRLQSCTESYWTWKLLYAKQPTPDQIWLNWRDNSIISGLYGCRSFNRNTHPDGIMVFFTRICVGVSIISFCASECTVQIVTGVFLTLHEAHSSCTPLQGTCHAHIVVNSTIDWVKSCVPCGFMLNVKFQVILIGSWWTYHGPISHDDMDK